ncbi:Spore protein YabQ [compost metagenome]
MISYQLYCFFVFFAIGIISGITFDIFRILRKTFKTIDFIIYIQDILFWIMIGFLLLYGLCFYTDGEIRLYLIIAVFLGFLVYIITISKYIILVCSSITIFIKNIFINIFIFLSNFAKKILLLHFFRGKTQEK